MYVHVISRVVVYQASVSSYVADHLAICLSVSRSVCLSAKCIVAKRLSGSGCRLGWWVGSV